MSISRRTGLGGQAAVYALSNVLNAGVPFLLLPILTRVLTPADYGRVAMFGILISVLNAIIGLNAHGAVTIRYFQLEPAHMRRYLGACVAVMFATVLLTSGILLIASDAVVDLVQIPRPWLFIAVLASAGQFMIALRLALWQVEKRAWTYGSFQVGQSVVNAGLSVLLVVAIGLGWSGRTTAQAFAVVLFGLLAAASLLRGRHMVAAADRNDVLDAVRFGAPLVPHATGALLIATIDRLMLTNLLGLEAAGTYVVAAQIGLALGLMTDAFNRAYAPWLIERLSSQDEALDRAIVRGTYAYFLVVTVIAVAIGALAPIILPLLVGEGFQGAASSVLFIALGYAFGGMYYMVTNYVFFAGQTGKLACVTILAGLFNVAVTFLLIEQNGLVGAAQGFMLSQAFLFIGTWVLAARCRAMPWAGALRPVTKRPDEIN